MSIYAAILFVLISLAGKRNQSAAFDPYSLPVMDSTLCNGFDFPVGDKNGSGWIAKGKTGDSTAAGIHTGPLFSEVNANNKQPYVYAIGDGKVIYAGKYAPTSGNNALIEHRFAENGKVNYVYSGYSGLGNLMVKEGDLVKRRQIIAKAGFDTSTLQMRVQAELRKKTLCNFTAGFNPLLNGKTSAWVRENYEDYIAFIKNHRKIDVPFYKSRLVVICKSRFKCYLFEKGTLKKTYEIALGQEPVGAKEKQGDLKVPEGEYSICEKTRGPFSTKNNWSAAYLGTRWICLTYPNTFDAARALEKKEITKEQYSRIEQATKAGIKPPQNTSLGGGIGLHGWTEEDWSNESSRAQTWGCVSFHNKDLNEFYDLVELKTPVIIIP